MKPLYTPAEFDAAKSRDSLPLECEECEEKFYKPKNRIQSRGKFGSKCDFCSLRCKAVHRNPVISVRCEECSVSFKKRPCEIKRSKHNFCSKSHAAKWHNAHKTKGTRISRLERWLQQQLPPLFPGLEFRFNQTDAVNAELDVFIKASGKTHDFSRGMKASHTGWFRKFSRSCREYTPDRCINQVWQLKDGKEA